MSDYPDNISTMEELDPEPEAKGRSYAREFVLGALLLVAVLGWAGWQAWQQDVKERTYRRAEQEVTWKRWELARSFFLSASGYRDADARAEQIAKLIEDRDEHFHAANLAMWSKRWVTALRELRSARDIHPNYGQPLYELEELEAQVYSNTLKGAIALRAAAEPPGLYYRAETGWVWLEGSDRWSQVLGATGGSVAYDVPGEGWQPGATPTPVPFNRQPPSGRPELQGRKLMLATLDGSGVAARQSTLDPAFYSYYLPVGDRIVAGRYNERPGTYMNAVRLGFTGWWLDYERVEAGRPISTSLSLGDPDETVLHASPENDLYVVAVAGGTSIRSSKIELYLGMRDEDGGYVRRPIYSHVGQLGGAQIGPDGRHMLLTTITPINNGVQEVQSALLFDLAAQTPPYTLTTRTVNVETVGGFVSFDTSVKGTFLREGEYAGKVLLVDREEQQLTLSLIDPAHPGTRTTLVQPPGNNYVFYMMEKPGGSELLLSGWAVEGNTVFSLQQSARLLFLKLTPGTEPVITYLPQIESGYLRSFGTRGGQLIYEQRTDSNRGPGMEVYAVPRWALTGEKEVAPMQVYTATGVPLIEGRGTGYSPQNPSWYPGEGAFAYTDGGNLYAREYDGSSEVRLESSVWQLIDPRAYTTANPFR